MGIRRPVEEARTRKLLVSLTPAEYRLLLERCGPWAPSAYLRRAAFSALEREGEDTGRPAERTS